MVANKTSSPIFNLAFRGVLIISLAGIVLLVEGLHPDPPSMASRVQQIIEAALERNSK